MGECLAVLVVVIKSLLAIGWVSDWDQRFMIGLEWQMIGLE